MKVAKKRELHPEEKELWRRVAKTVARHRRPLPPEEPVSEIIRNLPRTAVKADNKSIDRPKKARAQPPPPPADRGAEKRVRRGQVEIDASFDLHGHTQDSGRAALIGFLVSAQKRGARTVIVVTGQGRGGEGVLKRRFPDWIAAPELKGRIAGFAQAHRTHGGAGAFYVFLKRSKAD